MQRSHAPRLAVLAVLAVLTVLSMPFNSFATNADGATTTEIPSVTIHGTDDSKSLTQPSFENARNESRSIPGGASVISSEEYLKGRVSTVKDALDYAPGVFVQSRFGAEEARVSIRGSGLQRTFHGRGLKFLQDGVPLNLADGSYDYQAVEPLAADYVEVLRGANAAKYGTANLGGSVNFISRTGYNSSPFTARLEGGSFGYNRVQLASGGVSGPYDYAISLSNFAQDGFRQHSKQNTQRVFANAGIKISPDVENRAYVTFVKTDSQLPGNLTKAELDRDPTLAQRSATATSDVITSNQKRDFTLFRVADKTTWKIDATQKWETSVFWATKELHHPIFQVLADLSTDYGLDSHYTTSSDFLNQKNSFTAGLSYLAGSLIDRRYQNVFGSEGALAANNLQAANNFDVYVDNDHAVLERLTLTTGVQMSTAVRKNEDRFPVAGTDLDNTDSKSFSQFLPRLGLRYDLNDTTQIYTNYSYSFEPPSFGELVAIANQTGLVDLKAQTAKTIELGTRGSNDHVSWDASYYFAWVENELLTYEISPGVTRTINATSTYHQGLELGLDFMLTNHLVFKNNYLLSDFHFSADGNYGNGMLAGIPPHFYRAELRYEFGIGYYASMNVEASLAKYPVDFANTLFADPYATFGAKAGFATKQGLSYFIEAKNLSDVRYAATTGVIPRATATNLAQFLPGDGLSFYAGLQWAL